MATNTEKEEKKVNCVVTTCLYYGPLSGVSKFPWSNIEKCEKWKKSLGLESYKKNHYVCHAHFSSDDFHDLTDGKKRLKNGAVPKLRQNSVSLLCLLFSEFSHCFKITQEMSHFVNFCLHSVNFTKFTFSKLFHCKEVSNLY